MASLFHSGNFAGFIGLALMIWVGFRLVRTGHKGGLFLACGSGLVAFSAIFRLYLEPLLQKPLHLSFNHSLITLVTITPTMTLSFGFMLIPLGLFMIAARQQKELKPIPVRRR